MFGTTINILGKEVLECQIKQLNRFVYWYFEVMEKSNLTQTLREKSADGGIV